MTSHVCRVLVLLMALSAAFEARAGDEAPSAGNASVEARGQKADPAAEIGDILAQKFAAPAQPAAITVTVAAPQTAKPAAAPASAAVIESVTCFAGCYRDAKPALQHRMR